jgi:hypothetical protein
VSDKPSEIIKLMAFFTIYKPSEIEELYEDDFAALAGYCADRIIKANPVLEDVEIRRKEILASIRAELDRMDIRIKKLPPEYSLSQIGEVVFEKELMSKDYFDNAIDDEIEKYCRVLKIPRFVTIDDQI